MQRDEQAEIAGITRAELTSRVDRARRAAAAAGLDGLIVLGQGGGAFERYGDLLYLTGHYTTFPAIPDLPGHWTLRGHAAAVIGPDRVVLCTDDDADASTVAADEVRVIDDLAEAIGSAVQSVGLAGRPIGLVNANAVPADGLAAILARTGATVRADELVEVLRRVKSPAEQSLLRLAGAAGSAAITAAMDAAGEGATELEAASAAIRTAVELGAAVSNTFTSVYRPGRPPRHRMFPSYADTLAMEPGDIFAVDMSGSVDGYFFDFARSRVIGDDRHGGEELIDLVQRAIDAGVAAARAGATAGSVAAAGFAVLAAAGDYDPGRFPALGHGMGLGFEHPWLTVDNALVLEPGMCLAIENWTGQRGIAATFEHNLLVTDGAPEVLSTGRERW